MDLKQNIDGPMWKSETVSIFLNLEMEAICADDRLMNEILRNAKWSSKFLNFKKDAKGNLFYFLLLTFSCEDYEVVI